MDAVCQPLCEDCYTELRETLMERNGDVELTMRDASPQITEKIEQIFD